MNPNMLQAAAVSILDAPLSPINARTMVATTMTPVDPTAALEPTYTELGVSAYTHRDQELLQRDLTVASYIAQLCLQISTVWNVPINSLILPSVPPSVLQYQTTDLRYESSPSTPANVIHVENSSAPYDAYASDQDLYARDVIVYEMLARLSYSFPPDDRLVESLDANIYIDNTWSRAKASPVYGDVSISDDYTRATFFTPDRYLASRDNALAYHATQVNQFLLNILSGANRLNLRVQSTATTTLYPTTIPG